MILALGAQDLEDAAAACSPEEAELQACINDILDGLTVVESRGSLSTAFVRAINVFIVQRVRKSPKNPKPLLSGLQRIRD